MIGDGKSSARRLLVEVNSLFRANGWRDEGETALAVVEYAAAGGSLDPSKLQRVISRSFASANHTTKEAVAIAVAQRLARSGMPIASGLSSPRPILVLSADPLDQDPLMIQREMREIRDQIDKSPLRPKVPLELRPGLVYTELSRYLLEVNPIIVHFSGHGSVDGLFAEDAVGRSRLLPSSALSAVFRQPAVKQNVKLVVLNSCFSSVQALALSKHVSAVMGMRAAVGDQAAISFTGGLYMALTQGKSVTDAFEWGRAAITVEGLTEDQMPQLIAKPAGRSMHLFDPAA